MAIVFECELGEQAVEVGRMICFSERICSERVVGNQQSFICINRGQVSK